MPLLRKRRGVYETARKDRSRYIRSAPCKDNQLVECRRFSVMGNRAGKPASDARAREKEFRHSRLECQTKFSNMKENKQMNYCESEGAHEVRLADRGEQQPPPASACASFTTKRKPGSFILRTRPQGRCSSASTQSGAMQVKVEGVSAPPICSSRKENFQHV